MSARSSAPIRSASARNSADEVILVSPFQLRADLILIRTVAASRIPAPFSMSVARRFEFVIGPFLIIDLAKISAFPSFDERVYGCQGSRINRCFEPITDLSVLEQHLSSGD